MRLCATGIFNGIWLKLSLIPVKLGVYKESLRRVALTSSSNAKDSNQSNSHTGLNTNELNQTLNFSTATGLFIGTK